VIRFQKPQRGNQNVLFPALMAHWFAYCLFRLDGNRLNLSGMDSVLVMTMGLPTGIAWLAFTPARLRDLGLSRLWMLPFLVPFALSILAIWKGWHVLCWVTLIIGASVQWSLIFLVRQEAPLPVQIDETGGPLA
jgi:uncharacterized membrane protein YhaH (DUF805 family)